MDLEKLFYDQGEVQFIFNNKSYLLACYNVKKFFVKNKIEYCLYSSKNDEEDLQKFNSFDELLNVKIDGQKLKDILNKIEIIE